MDKKGIGGDERTNEPASERASRNGRDLGKWQYEWFWCDHVRGGVCPSEFKVGLNGNGEREGEAKGGSMLSKNEVGAGEA